MKKLMMLVTMMTVSPALFAAECGTACTASCAGAKSCAASAKVCPCSPCACKPCACGMAANTLCPAEQKDGWKLLWDGKTGEGWRTVGKDAFPATGWVMKDGELTILSKKEEAKRPGDLITKEVYKNFILKVDFRLTYAANSGIKYLFDPKLNGGTTIEYQVLDPAHPDAQKGINGNRKVASFYDVMPAVNAHAKPLGEWNQAMIVCKGNHVEHWLNGEKVLEFERGSQTFRDAVAKSKFSKWPKWGEQASGHILLQDHGDHVSYRNLKIKTLE